MKGSLLLPVFLFAPLLWTAPIRPLPGVIARINGKELRSDVIRRSWERSVSMLPEDVSPETVERLYRKLVDEAVWQNEIAAMLAEQGIKPDRETAEKYLNSLLKDIPADRAQNLKLANLHVPDAPDMKLKAAIHFYLKRMSPQAVKISSEEIEEYYRNNQMRFKKPGKVVVGILALKDKKQAEMARAALLQGAAFDAVAQLYTEGHRPEPTEEIFAKVKKMRVNEVSELSRNDGFWQVIQLRSRTPESFLSLKEAAPLISLELSARKEGLALTRLLRERLHRKKIEYIPLPRQ